MASFSEDLYRALCAELKLSARRRGLTLRQEIERRCLAVAADDPEIWNDVVERVMIGRDQGAPKERKVTS
jgi:hypothetical protein